jgi:diguanylate cyclase (GGDEF)-like protein
MAYHASPSSYLYASVMVLDQHSLFIAIGVSCTALALTLLATWVVARSETYLLTWSTGLALTVLALLFYLGIERYDADYQLVTFALLILGFGLIYRGTIQFCARGASWTFTVAVTMLGLVPTTIAFVAGYTGTGTAIANFAVALLITLAALQYWRARAEAPLLMMTNALLYLATAASFVACGAVLMANGQYVLTARPSNWAEELNSLMVIVGLTGIGALSLTINQIRTTNRHKSDAMTDPLTGLLNRRALLDDTAQEVPLNTALLVMDLDHFKAINDKFGHGAGDRVLRAFAEVIFSNIRAEDVAARLGGEEFCILLSASSPKAASAVAERIRATLETKLFQTATGPIAVTVSVGVAIRLAEPETLQSLLSRADAALYQAKAAGRNRVHISDFHLAA